MIEATIDNVVKKIREASELYYKLVLVVGPAGSRKTEILRKVAAVTSAPFININLELSSRMLDMTERQRILQLSSLLDQIIAEYSTDLILLDNTEILFDVRLKHDPLRLLQKLSRNRTVVASWNGAIVDNYITYAIPGHPEYRKYPITDFLVINLTQSKNYEQEEQNGHT